jgi:hypothetical protein
MMKKARQILSCPEWWLIIIPIFAYWQIAFCQYTMKWDMTDQVFVWHRFISECFHHHILPLWCPYSRLGYPFFADPQSGLFYPVTWVFTYFFHYSLYTNNLEFIVHVIGAAFGMKFLLESLQVRRYTACIFGIVYALSGPFVSNATHIVFIYSLCWLPFILGSYIRLLQTGQYRYSLLMAIFLFLQISGGYMGISIILFYVLIFILLYYLVFLFRVRPQRLPSLLINHILVGGFTALLSVGFIYAVSKGLPYIDRQNGLSKEMANSIAFTPFSFLTFLFPFIGDNDLIHFGTDLTMRNIYIGSLTLLLAFCSLLSPRRFTVFVLAGSIFFLLAALGGHAPVRSWLYGHLPLMNMFRMAGIFRFFACIGLLVLAAYAFDEIFERGNKIPARTLRIIIGAAGPLSLLFFCVILVARRHGLHPPHTLSLLAFTEYLKHAGIWSVIFLQGIIHSAILGSVFFILMYMKFNSSIPKYLFAGLIALDMIIAVQGNIFSTVASTKTVGKIQSRINKLPEGFPVISNVPLSSYNEWNDSALAPPLWHNAGFLRKQVTFDGYNGYNLTAYNQLADRQDFYKIIQERKFIMAYPDSAEISITKFNPCQISFTIKSKRDETVGVGQFFFAGWQVKIDGNKGPGKLTEDSLHLIQCSLPSGNHLVELSFEPGGVRFSFIYTILVFITGIVCTVILFFRRFIPEK